MNTRTVPRVPWSTMVLATAIYAASMLLHAAILHARHRAPEAAVPAVIVLAIGAFGSAVILWRQTAVPAWSRFASAGVISLAMVLVAQLAPETIVARKAEIWLLPWCLLLMGSAAPPRGEAACVRPETMGRVVFGTSAFVGAVYVFLAIAPRSLLR